MDRKEYFRLIIKNETKKFELDKGKDYAYKDPFTNKVVTRTQIKERRERALIRSDKLLKKLWGK